VAQSPRLGNARLACRIDEAVIALRRIGEPPKLKTALIDKA
jgi:hypothetical protein